MGMDDRERDYSTLKELGKTDSTNANLVQTGIKLWRPLTVVFLYWVLQFERSDLTGAFLRSRIECPLPRPSAATGLCPKGSTLEAGVCHAEPPGSKEWSGSAYCANKFLVVQRAMVIGGQMSSFATICSLIAQVFVGSMLVDSWGRKPVMLLGLVGSAMCTFLFLVSCFVQHSAFLGPMFAGVAVFALANAFPAASLAMTSDLSQNNITQRGFSYTAIHIVQHVGILVAFGAGYFILALDLTDYRRVWWIFMCVCILVVVTSAFLLHETLVPESEGSPILDKEAGHGQTQQATLRDQRSLLSVALSEVVSAYRIVWHDVFLRCSLALTFMASVATVGAINITNGYCISVVGLDQAVASLAGVFHPAAMVCGSALSTWFFARFGTYMTYAMGIALSIFGYVITGLAAAVPSGVEAVFWSGWITLGFGWGMAFPSHNAFNSIRVRDKNDHGKLFAAFGFVTALGSTVGSLIWTNFLFKREMVETWMAGLGYFLSALMSLCVLCGYGGLWLLVIRPEQEGANAETSAESAVGQVRVVS